MGTDDGKVDRGWKIFALALVGTMLGIKIGRGSDNYIPKTEQVQAGYAVPAKLEIRLEDTDGNGLHETILKYDGRSYRLTVDGEGNPRVQTYGGRLEQ